MKYALLVSRTLGNGTVNGWKNIGDYVQSLAAEQFMPKVDEYFDKTGDDFGTDTVKMIMNAWYIWNPEKFPLSKRVIPLPLSMHISPVCAEKLLSLPTVLDWFKAHEPIGCRDTDTMGLLKAKGIDSYFSACLTLTLGKNYRFTGERKGLVFVDPYLAALRKELSAKDIASALLYGARHFKALCSVAKKMDHTYCFGHFAKIKRGLYSAILLKTYSTCFSPYEIADAAFVSHMVKVGEGTLLQTEEEKMAYAEALVKKYASSRLVVTGRIHCALPCLGVETPVIFTVGHSLEEGSQLSGAGRFGGLIDLLTVARVKKLHVSGNFTLPLKNKDLYKPYAEKLVKQCTDFMRDDSQNFAGGGTVV